MGNVDMKEIFSHLDALAVKDRVEAAISLAEQYNANATLGEVKLIPLKRIRLDNGIGVAADALGVGLQRFRVASGNYLYYFIYKGWEFTQESEKPLAVPRRIGKGKTR